MSPNRCYESMTRFTVGGWRVRVWRAESEQNKITDEDLVEYANNLTSEIVERNFVVTRRILLERISAMPHVAAVEVTDGAGCGCLVYPDWK